MSELMTAQMATMNQQIGELISLYRDAINRMGISENEYWVWHTLLAMEGEFSQQDICNLWALSKQTINTIVTNMVKKEYAVLETEPGSRNRKIIRLTPTGREHGYALIAPLAQAEQHAFERVPMEVRLACILGFKQYLNVLSEEVAQL